MLRCVGLLLIMAHCVGCGSSMSEPNNVGATTLTIKGASGNIGHYIVTISVEDICLLKRKK